MKKVLFAFVALMGLMYHQAQAQMIIDTWSFSTGVDTTLWMDLGEDYMTLFAGSNGYQNYASSGLRDIGFPFTLGTTTHTKFSTNVNGTVRLGTTIPSSGYITEPLGQNINAGPRIDALGRAGMIDTSCYMRSAVLGDSGSRVLVVEARLREYADRSESEGHYVHFQVQLFEAGGLRVVYGQVDPGAIYGSSQNGVAATGNSSNKDVVFFDFASQRAVRFNGNCTLRNAAEVFPTKGRWYMIAPDPEVCPWSSTVTIPTNPDAGGVLLTRIAGDSNTMRVTIAAMDIDTVWDAGEDTMLLPPLNPTTNYTLSLQTLCGSDTSFRTRDIEFFSGCGAVVRLPWSATFNSDAEANCWDMSQYTISNGKWRRVLSYMRSGLSSSTLTYNEWLRSPVINLPDDNGLTLQWDYMAVPRQGVNPTEEVRVAICDADGNAALNDYLLLRTDTSSTSSYETQYLNLDAYRGQRVKVAFVRTGTGGGYTFVDNVQFYQQQSPIAVLQVPETVFVEDSSTYNCYMLLGVDSNMTCTFHSSLLDTTWVEVGTQSSEFGVIYNEGGLDTITMILENAYGADTATAIVNVADCRPVTAFPWVDDFSYQPYCWTLNDWNWSSNGQCMYSSSLNCNMLTQPIAIPSTGVEHLSFWVECRPPLMVRVSSTASIDTADYTDTVLVLANSTNEIAWQRIDFSSYAGDTVRVGLFHLAGNQTMIRQVKVDYDTLPVLGQVVVPAKSRTDSTIVCTATQRFGATEGIVYTWHSTLLDSTAVGDTVCFTYTFCGTDTITLVLSNAFGNDTAVNTVRVIDCTPATMPWKETFVDGILCWYQHPGGKFYDTNPYSGSYYANYRSLCINIQTDTAGSWIISKEIQIPSDSNLLPILTWKVASYNEYAYYHHLYSVLVTDAVDYTDTANYVTLYTDSIAHSDIYHNFNVMKVGLSDYVGRNVHIAFHNYGNQVSSNYNCLYIDDVEVRSSAVPVVKLSADKTLCYYGDTATFTATLMEGSDSGLVYIWHSSLLDSTWTTNGDNTQCSLTYGMVNGTDTVTMLATNAYGSDTASVAVMSQVINQPVAYLSILEKSPHMRVDKAEVGDTVVYVVTRNRCVTIGLTYSLHSTLEDTTITVTTTADTCYFPLIYTNEGVDSITVNVSNTYGSGQDSVRMNIYNCPVATVPFFEDFNDMGGTGYLTCWPGYWWLQGRGDSNYAVRLSGSAIHQALISPAIDLPADTLGLQLSWYAQFTSNATPNVPIRIMVSPTGSAHIADFTDELYNRTMPNYSYDSVSLDAYRGQRVRLAFYFSGYYGLFDDIKIDYDRSVPRLTVSGPTTAATLEDNVYTANVTAGSPHGLTYNWRSSMADQGLAHYRIQDSEFIINYFTDGTDTIRCIVANDYGADTQTVVVPVSGCGYVQLPYFEDFNAMAVGSKPDCWSVVWHKEPSCAPKVVAPGSFYFSPDNSRLLFLAAAANSTYYDTAAIVLLPAFDFPVASLKMSLWYAYEDTTIGTLSAGYMDNGQFVPVTELPVVGHSGRYDTISFATAPATATRLALCWKQMTNSTWYSASIDNVEVTTAALPHDVIHLIVNDSTATEISLDGPAAVYALDTNRYSAVVTAGPDSGLTYTWHSSLAARGLAQFSTLHSSLFTINYTSTGIDTVWLTVSNGMDTGVAYRVVTITAPLEVAITGPTRAIVGEGQSYQAAVTVGSHYGVSYSWHSTLLNSTWIDTTGVIDSIVLVYPFGGTDTLSVTATSPFTTYTASMVVTVTNCNISVFPAFEGFENDNCWITVNTVAGQGWTRRSAYRRSGNWSMEAVYPTHGNPTDDWLISPAIDLPANGTVTMTYYRFFQESEPFDRNYEPKVQMRVSTTGRSDTTLFTDTIPITYIGLIGNFWKAYSVSLADYQGQTVYLAFRNRETVHPGGYSSMEWHLAIDDLAFTVDQVPVISLNTDEVYYTCDTAVATVDINRYDSLEYDIRWHSRMVDRGLAQFEVRGSEFRIDYLVGGRDTISVVVSNAYGSDSVWRAVDVHYCEVVNDFPHVFRPVTDDAEWGCWKRWNLSPDRYGGWGRGYDYYNHGYGSYLCIMSKATYNSSYNPDEWLVSPLIALPSNAESITLHWHGFCEESTFNLEISTTGRDSAAQFTTTLYSQTNGSLYTPQMQEHWSYYNVDLSSYRGQTVSLAFHNVGPVHYPYGYVALDTMWIECTLDTTPVPPDTVWRTVTLSCDTAMGTVSGAGVYPDSSAVAVSATPFEGYHFVAWNDNDTHTVRTLMLVSDTAFTAYFAADSLPIPPPDTVWYTVTIVTKWLEGWEGYADDLNAYVTGAGTYREGDTVTLSATYFKCPAGLYGWVFVPGDTIMFNPYSFAITSDTVVTAVFVQGVGIEELPIFNSQFSIYPNPATTMVTIVLDESMDANTLLQVLDQQGRCVFTQAIKQTINQTITIDVSRWTAGTYFVRLVTDSGAIVKKLILR